MTKTMIRLASEQDAEKLQQLMHEAFTPLRELGIDWPSVNPKFRCCERKYR